jgi:glyoxylase-like metal-dependent hydrolase (beta-lactamase superfamily II)
MDVLGAVAEISSGYPITHMIYTHSQTDHIGGEGVIKAAFPDVQIIAHKKTKRLLVKMNDPIRPVPTKTFVKTMTVSSGGKQLKLSYRGNTHMPGNIFVYAPKEKILMVVDVIFPGWVPFRRMALSDDIGGWIKGNKAVLDFDFDTLIAGHVTKLGTRADVELQLEYVQDIIDSFDSIMDDPNTLFNAISAYDSVHGPGAALATNAKWALFSAFFDAATMACADLLDAKYTEGASSGYNPRALAGAEVFNFSNCEAYFVARRIGVVEVD